MEGVSDGGATGAAAAAHSDSLAPAADTHYRTAGGRGRLVVIDMELPDAWGDELMRELRRRHGYAGIAITGHDDAARRRRFLHQAGSRGGSLDGHRHRGR